VDLDADGWPRTRSSVMPEPTARHSPVTRRSRHQDPRLIRDGRGN
jgi:hypothetical protein